MNLITTPAGIYLLKVNNRNASVVVMVSLLLTSSIFHTLFFFSIFNFEHVIAGWESCNKIIICIIYKNVEQTLT